MTETTNPPPTKSFTGRGRRKQTPWTVRSADVIAKWVITVGGIGTIVAVSVVFLFLFAVVAPLFWSATIEQEVTQPLAAPPAADRGGQQPGGPSQASATQTGATQTNSLQPNLVLASGLDEFRTSTW